MKPKKYTIDMEIERDGETFEVQVTGECTLGTPERIPPANRPEDYDPGADPEFEVTHVKRVMAGTSIRLDLEGCLTEKEEKLAGDMLLQRAADEFADDDSGPDMDDRDDRDDAWDAEDCDL
jgi:hypothetical protein